MSSDSATNRMTVTDKDPLMFEVTFLHPETGLRVKAAIKNIETKCMHNDVSRFFIDGFLTAPVKDGKGGKGGK